MTIVLHGISLPFTEIANATGPGWTIWTCDKCGWEVYRKCWTSRGTTFDGDLIIRENAERERAFRFHMDFCKEGA